MSLAVTSIITAKKRELEGAEPEGKRVKLGSAGQRRAVPLMRELCVKSLSHYIGQKYDNEEYADLLVFISRLGSDLSQDLKPYFKDAILGYFYGRATDPLLQCRNIDYRSLSLYKTLRLCINRELFFLLTNRNYRIVADMSVNLLRAGILRHQEYLVLSKARERYDNLVYRDDSGVVHPFYGDYRLSAKNEVDRSIKEELGLVGYI